MLKVDLHLHSKNSNKIGDSVSWNSLEDTINTIKNNDISVFSFTDHDMFSYKLYLQTKKHLKDNKLKMFYYPGLELTVTRENKKRGHVLFIFDNRNEELIKKLEEITQDLVFLNKELKLKKAINTYNKLGLDYFIIPHVDKSDFLVYDDMKEVKEKIYYLEALPTSREFKRFQKEAEGINVMPVKFSDHHHWTNNSFSWAGNYILKLETFEDLKSNILFMEES